MSAGAMAALFAAEQHKRATVEALDTGGSAASKVVGIMQPTYLPWAGYFAMLDACDVFVLLDTVAIDTKSWQTRNRIRGRDGNVVWLSVPTHASQGQALEDVGIDTSKPWTKKHGRTIEAAYSHTPGWADVERAAVGIEGWHFLAEMTAHTIDRIAHVLGITTPILRASTLGPAREDKVGRIEDICHAVNADRLLDTPNATFLKDQPLQGITIDWFDYEHPTYTQGKQEWMSHLSVIDLIAWHPSDALAIIRQGHEREHTTP